MKSNNLKDIIYITETSLPSLSANIINSLKFCDAFAKYYKVNFFLPKCEISQKKIKEDFGLENDIYFREILKKNISNSITRFYFCIISVFKIVTSSKKTDIIIGRSIICSLILALFNKKNLIEIHHNLNGFTKILFNLIIKTYFKKNLVFIIIHQNLIEDLKIKNLKYIVLDDAADIKKNKNQFNNKFKNACVYTGSFFNGKGIELILRLSRLMPNIEFPFGHPKVNDVYISHPFKEDLYYPVDEMEFRVFVDKIEEYSHFLQSLGAREIKIDTYKNENFTSKSNNNSKVRLDISVEKISSSNNMEINQENESYDSFQQRFNKAMMFSPTKKPHLPDDMVWYPVEPSWQRLYSQRINGNIVEYEEIIKTSHHNTLSEREMLDINSEVNYFFNKAKINRKRTSKSSVNRNKEIEWKIKVVFAPIGELKEDVGTEIVSIERPISADSVYSSDELSFMELIKTALSDSEISDDEMRVIDRQRDRMGISEVRAKELIDSIQRNKSFSPEEVEFIEEIEFCLSDDGQISEDELNLLDRLRVKLNISEDRSKDLIGLFFNKNS